MEQLAFNLLIALTLLCVVGERFMKLSNSTISPLSQTVFKLAYKSLGIWLFIAAVIILSTMYFKYMN